MADFAITLWVWEATSSATALALTGFFFQLPSIITSLFAGVLVDRVSRKSLMILSEVAAALSILVLLILHWQGHLALWHLYAAFLLNGSFERFGGLAYWASMTSLISSADYIRANSMNGATGYIAGIVAPGIAGLLYPIVGLGGMWLINLAALAVVIVVLVLLEIPQQAVQQVEDKQKTTKGQIDYFASLWAEITFGIRYIWRSPGLRSLLIITTLFWGASAGCSAIFDPMILARSGGSSEVLGAIITMAGVSGIGSAIALSIWGGFRQNVRGMLVGFSGAGLAKIVFGLGQGLSIWLPAQFCSSLNYPLLKSSERALWMSATPPDIQGRIFAARSFINDTAELAATLLAGVLSDRVFEPGMRSSGLLQFLFGPMFGVEAGAGIALLYVGGAVGMLLVGLFGFRLSGLRSLEALKLK